MATPPNSQNFLSPEQFAPPAVSYTDAPDFKYAATQRQTDFAQMVAAGGDLVDALVVSSLVTQQEAATLSRDKLYAMAAKQFKLPAVQEQIDYYRVLHQKSMSITIERIQQELAATAFADFAECYTPTGEAITNPHDIPRHTRAAIKEFSNDPLKGVKVKMHDKLTAVKMLGELQGYFAEADRAKAPKIEINLSSTAQSLSLPEPSAPRGRPPVLLSPGAHPGDEEGGDNQSPPSPSPALPDLESVASCLL